MEQAHTGYEIQNSKDSARKMNNTKGRTEYEEEMFQNDKVTGSERLVWKLSFSISACLSKPQR